MLVGSGLQRAFYLLQPTVRLSLADPLLGSSLIRHASVCFLCSQLFPI
ncbi:hypothetical protein TIFTF001_043928, partial [Ficus carica]